MKELTKAISFIALLLVSMLSVMTNVEAAYDASFNVRISDVIINGDSLNEDQVYQTELERDSELPITVKVLQTSNDTKAQGVRVEVSLWSEKDLVDEMSDPFDLAPNTFKYVKFNLKISERVNDENYQLKVRVSSANGESYEVDYPVQIAAVSHSVAIKELVLSPNDKVVAGRALMASARLKNYGKNTEEDVKVTISIPELGVEETDYINEIESDEAVSTEDLLLRIPANTKAGLYTVKVTAFYDDGDEDTSATYQIQVVGNEAVLQTQSTTSTGASLSGKVTISVGPQAQTVARGESGVVYPVTINNGESVAKTITLVASGTNDWATVKMSPSNVVVVNPGETKNAYVYLAASENAALGEHVFGLDVKVGNTVVQQVPLKADVLESATGSAWDGVKKALQVGVILLLVLIIVLAIVIAYQKKFKGSDSKIVEDEQIPQTYY